MIRSGSWKLIEFFEDGHLELYNLSDDIGERHDVSSANQELAASLHAELQAWRTKIGAPLPTPRTPEDDSANRESEKKVRKKQKSK